MVAAAIDSPLPSHCASSLLLLSLDALLPRYYWRGRSPRGAAAVCYQQRAQPADSCLSLPSLIDSGGGTAVSFPVGDGAIRAALLRRSR